MKGKAVIEGASLLDPEQSEPCAERLLLENGRIAGRLSPREPVPEDCRVVSLPGASICPGFLDLHFHGELIFAAPDALDDAVTRTAASLLRHGTTGFLATTMAWPQRRLHAFVTHLASSLTRLEHGATQSLGIHLEGPWIRPEAAGAQPKDGIRPFDAREGRELVESCGGLLRMVTLAPEVEGARALLALMRRESVVCALGHSLASPDEIDAGARHGMTHVTHLFNAMGPMHHREPGVAGCAMTDSRFTADLICDGAHVHPRMVRVAAQALGDRLILITDRVSIPDQPSGDSAGLVDDGTALRLPGGRLAGSSLTLDRAVRNADRFGALGRLEAVAACTLRPARVLGIERERGTLRPGARADLAVLDADGEVLETWISGEPVFRRADATLPQGTRDRALS